MLSPRKPTNDSRTQKPTNRLMLCVGLGGLVFLLFGLSRQTSDLLRNEQQNPARAVATDLLRKDQPSSSLSLRGGLVADPDNQCRFYLAESAIPRGGLALYTAIELKKGEMTQPTRDICIYVADTPDGTDFETHSWSAEMFMAAHEGEYPRGACEGVATMVNSMPYKYSTSTLKSLRVHTNGGLHRYKNPGAGAISHYYGITSKAHRDVEAGSELTIQYGDWEHDMSLKYKKPIRPVAWLQKYGMCIDNIKIGPANDPQMGRGAFANHPVAKGQVLAPAPLQVFPDRGAFAAHQVSEALFVNYCFQPPNTTMLLYPYGPGVNLINHSRERANVAVRWSTSKLNHMHWLDLPLEQFWQMSYPGGLLIEYVALRDIAEDEEIFLDYGSEWDRAWKKHVRKWRPVADDGYVYPQEMKVREPIRTLVEQETRPYAKNLATVCVTGNYWNREQNRTEWQPTGAPWPIGLAYCHVLNRKPHPKQLYLYEVVVETDPMKPDLLSKPRNEWLIDYNVPQSAFGFVDKPYKSDLHLPNAFRHTIAWPDHLTPSAWKRKRP